MINDPFIHLPSRLPSKDKGPPTSQRPGLRAARTVKSHNNRTVSLGTPIDQHFEQSVLKWTELVSVEFPETEKQSFNAHRSRSAETRSWSYTKINSSRFRRRRCSALRDA